MKIIICLRNGNTLELLDCSGDDFKKLISHMTMFSRFFIWNDVMFIRKSDVVAFSLVDEINKGEKKNASEKR